MALESSSAWTKPAFRVTAAAFGSFLAGPLGCATGAFLGGMLGDVFGKSAANFVASCAEKFGEAAAEKLLGTRLDSLASRFKAHSGEIEKVYREALQESLVAIHSEVGGEFEDWFENWDACLKSEEPLDLEQIHPGELVAKNLDGILCRTMERLDAQGQARKAGSLSLQVEFRHLPYELRTQIEDRLAGHFGESFRGLIVREEYQQAWRESEQVYQDWLCDTLTRIHEQLKELRVKIDFEFQKVLRVIDAAFLEKSKAGPTTPFLNISKGDWALVAQGRAIERNLAQQVSAKLLEPHDDRAILQCVRGEPGSGKTTLLLEIGVQLVESGCTVLEVLPGASLDDFRYFASKLSMNRTDRLFILVDDIYKDDYQATLIVDFLSTPGELLPITIIATTPSFADRTKSIRENSFLDVLPPVSADNLTDREIEQFRKMPGVAAYDQKLFETLLKTRRILVVMLQLTAGKPIDQILLDTALRLKKHFPETYLAWGIIVTFSAHNLPVPSSLLNRMLGIPFYSDSLLKSPEKVGSEGIIFQSPFLFKEGWFSGHILIARYAFEAAFADSLRRVCTAAVQCASTSDPEHGVFLGRMFRILSSGLHGLKPELLFAFELFRSNREMIRNLAVQYPEAMADWVVAFRNLREKELAVRCLLGAKPTSPGHAVEVADGLEQFGKVRKALELIVAWCDLHPDELQVRVFYLAITQRHGTKEEVHDAIVKTRKWLKCHDDDTYVRFGFLALVEQKGTANELKNAMEETARWLNTKGHADVTNVRGLYLGMVDRCNSKEVPKMIAQTKEWLEGHDEDTFVRRIYLSVAERSGTSEAVQNLIAQTREWLKRHDGDTSIRTRYLRMVEEYGTPSELEEAISETARWLGADKHSDVASVRGFYLGMVERHGTPEDVQSAIAQTKQWLNGHDEDTVVRTSYLGLVERHAKSDLDQAIDDAVCWLREHSGGSDVWSVLIAILVRSGKTERAVEMTAEAVELHPEVLNLMERYLDLIASERAEEEVAKVFDQLEARFPCTDSIPLRRVRWLMEAGKTEEADAIYVRLVEQYPQRYQIHFAYGRYLLKVEEWTKARKEFEAVLSHNIGHQMAHEGKALALRGLASRALEAGNQEHAKKYLEWAEQHFRSAISWANRQLEQPGRFYASIGWFYLDQDRCEEALSFFDAAIREGPEYFSNYWGRGDALLRLGRSAEAIDALETALARAPKPLEPPASDEIPRLLAEARKRLES